MGPNGRGDLVLQNRGAAREDVVEGELALECHVSVPGAAEAV